MRKLVYFLYFNLILFDFSRSEDVPLVLGVDMGTESCRVGFFTLEGRLIAQSAASYKTHYPQTGHVEQLPQDWWTCLGIACQAAIKENKIDVNCLRGIAVDTTACSVVLLDQQYEPIAPCILYCDARSAPQTQRVIELGKGDPYLQVCNDGRGPISAEWMIPKCLWVKENAPELWESAKYICEKNDYLNYRLSGRLVASGCHVAARWNWDAEEAVKGGSSTAGRPISLLRRLNMEDLLDKWPRECVAMGRRIGELTPEAAVHLGLPAGLPLTQAGPDAYVGMVGLGAIRPGQMALITGSTHLHLCVCKEVRTHAGMWGSYRGAPLPGLCFAEGGQSSTGSMLAWARRLLLGTADPASLSYQQLDEEAARVAPGCDGLLCLETFQGARTPQTDPLARGALVGLSLFHQRGHIWRALLESVCYGTKSCLDAMEEAGVGATEVLMAGGATRSALWLQMHADVMGRPVVVGEFDNAPLLGSAVLAAVGAGEYSSVEAAVRAMVRPAQRIHPRPDMTRIYHRVHDVYRRLAAAVRDISHTLASKAHLAAAQEEEQDPASNSCSPLIMPSILAGDFANLGQECRACVAAGAEWLHVDVFDGSAVCSGSLSFGPATVAAMHRACPTLRLDVHIAAANPAELIAPLVEAGASRITLQVEMFSSSSKAVEAIRLVRSLGVTVGICIAPTTSLSVITDLLALRDLTSGELTVEVVNVLAVKPGIGGQPFNPVALDKVQQLRTEHGGAFKIAVDGGIGLDTARACVLAGADILIAGTALFGRDRVTVENSDDGLKARTVRLKEVALGSIV